jgi:inner membrane protein involved in colicin E2 resistance
MKFIKVIQFTLTGFKLSMYSLDMAMPEHVGVK